LIIVITNIAIAVCTARVRTMLVCVTHDVRACCERKLTATDGAVYSSKGLCEQTARSVEESRDFCAHGIDRWSPGV
jgi:hypothetical protein